MASTELKNKLSAIGNATREKTGITEQMSLEEIATAINGIVVQEDLTTEMSTQDNLIAEIQTALAGKAAGGGEGVKTCNVQIKTSPWTQGVFLGVLAYTKLVDGEIEPVHIADYEEVDEFDIMLENVVCGTVISIKWGSPMGSMGMEYDEDCITIVEPNGDISDPYEFIVKPNATDTVITL